MAALIEVEGLRKTYRRAKRLALDDLTFRVEEGAIYAFVGPNGSGKTTTLRIIATLLAFDSGRVLVGGYDVNRQPNDVRRLLGYLPDEFGLYKDMLVREYLEFFAACYGIAVRKRRPLVDDLLDLVGLAPRADSLVRTLSRGMRQRLSLARALVHDPLLLIADEPAAGLDPRARIEQREMFKVLQEMGKTIFLSSHVLRELDTLATHVALIERGRLVTAGPLELIRRRLRPQRRLRITLLDKIDDAQAWLVRRPEVTAVEREPASGDGRPALLFSVAGDEEAVVGLLREMVSAEFPVLSFVEERETLETLFLDLTEGGIS